jgi:hypothetical protein
MAGTGETPDLVYVVIVRHHLENRLPKPVIFRTYEAVKEAYGKTPQQKEAIHALKDDVDNSRRGGGASITFDQHATTIYIEPAVLHSSFTGGRRKGKTLRRRRVA